MNLLRVNGFCAKYEWCRPRTVRQWLAERKDNGFSQCVIRNGRHILLDEDAVMDWLEAQREVPV